MCVLTPLTETELNFLRYCGTRRAGANSGIEDDVYDILTGDYGEFVRELLIRTVRTLTADPIVIMEDTAATTYQTYSLDDPSLLILQ